MAKSLEDPSFWLPSDFLANDVMDLKAPSFPTEFPYEFDSSGPNSALSSPVEESDVGSTEMESSDEEDFLAGLTRRLAQSSLSQTQKFSVPSFTKEKQQPEWVMSGSPQSTLTGIGCCSSNGSPAAPSSQVPSPPTTPFGGQNDTWDLIYAAAGQVARLKMNSVDGAAKFSNNNNGRGLLGPPRTPSPSLPCVQSQTPFTQFQQVRQDQVLQSQCSASPWGKPMKLNWSAQQQIQNRGRNIAAYESGRCGHVGLPLSQNTWPPLQAQHQNPQHPHRNTRPVLRNGSNVKRESTGTGVFLPRRYSNPNPTPEPPRKRAGCPTVLLPAKVVQALNLSFEDMTGHHHHQQHHHVHGQPRFNNTALAPNHEALVARRNAILAQQRRGLRQDGPLNYEVRLPQEWTY